MAVQFHYDLLCIFGDGVFLRGDKMTKYVDWSERIAESKVFKYSIWGSYFLLISIIVLILFMVGSFLLKIYILDYRFDDGELHPPIGSIQEQS